MINDHSEGGLKMIDLISLYKALNPLGKCLDPEYHGNLVFITLNPCSTNHGIQKVFEMYQIY